MPVRRSIAILSLAALAFLARAQVTQPGLNLEDPPLRNWAAALARARSSVVNVIVFGDSLSACYQPACGGIGPTSASSRYPDQLRSYFTAQGLSHGTGIIPVLLQLAGPALNSSFWTLSGSWSEAGIIGPYQQGYPLNNGSALIQMRPGGTATLGPQTGDALKVYCAEYSDSSSGLNVAIDGVTVGTACATLSNSALALAPAFAAPGGLGAHTAVLTSNSTGNAYLYGAEWTAGNTGISVHNLSVGAAVAEFFGYNISSQLAFSDLIAAGPQLAITLLGTNEPGIGASVSSYSTALTNLVQHEQTLGSSVLIIAPPPLGTSQGSTLPAYRSAAQGIATAYGAAFIDFSQWGSFAQANANELYQADGVHLNDNGQNDLFQIIAGGILGYNTSAPFNGGAINNPVQLTASNVIPLTVVNPVPTQISAVLYGYDSCASNHAFWQGETGAGYIYSVPNAFVLFDCINGQFPLLVFPSGNVSISGSNYGQRNGGSWSIPTEQGVSLQVTGGLSTDTLTIAPTVPQPSCSLPSRGTFWFVQAASGAADHLQVCAKSAADTYSWMTVF